MTEGIDGFFWVSGEVERNVKVTCGYVQTVCLSLFASRTARKLLPGPVEGAVCCEGEARPCS